MRLTCNRCGKSVSNEMPDDTVVRAWIECPECIAKEGSLECWIRSCRNNQDGECRAPERLRTASCALSWFLTGKIGEGPQPCPDTDGPKKE